ncbi:MAG TPA: DNA-processing protein DprA [Nevskiaceae bacterium]|nr:DNA-processing protein DprA [Nevskiaceae bacterium]
MSRGDELRGLLSLDDPRYPARLREIADPPAALHFRGDPELLGLPQIAIVGSRNATPQGLEIAEAFASELAGRGIVITSGLALGIDGAAHRGALAAGGTTIAVCGTGLDRIYPAKHRALGQEIVAKGLMVSEFPPGTPAIPGNFPQRNRIISGLSLGVLVVEAALDSGSLITARLAAEQGRDVFAIPGSIHNVMVRGCHRLIRQGAKLVESVDDILEEIAPQLAPWLEASKRAVPPANEPPAQHAALLAVLGDRPLSVDALVEKLRQPVDVIAQALTELELEGHIRSMPGGRVMRVTRS